MITLTDYTACDSVRAVLGVSEEEVPDTVLASPIYATLLSETLLELSAALATTYITTKDKVTRTADEQRFVDLTQTFSAYSVASKMLGSLPMFAPMTIKDSKAMVTRIQDPFAALKEDVAGTYTYIKDKLLAAFAVVSPANPAPNITTRTLVVATGLGLDPVTNK